MDFLQQAIALLSEPPGSIIYHLVTLFALQVVFAFSYSRWRRNAEDAQAQRLMWASAAIFLGRVILLAVGLVNSDNPQQTAAIFPPLEQAINTMTITFLVWSLIPQKSKSSRSFDITLIVILVLSGILYLFFAQEWIRQIGMGVTYYNSTLQATIWSILQIIILAGGLAYLLLQSGLQDALPIIIIFVLLFATLANLFNRVEFVQTDTNIPYMVRLGFMIALPLWAVFAYQYSLTPLLNSESAFKSSAIRFGSAMDNAAQIIATGQLKRRIAMSIEMASKLLEAEFVAIGLIDSNDPEVIRFSSNIRGRGSVEPDSWAANLTQIPTFNLALSQGNTIELLPDGIGARQLHDFYKIMGIEPRGPLLIHPLVTNEQNLGLLVVAAKSEQPSWSLEKQELLPGLARYLAQAILNSQRAPTQVVVPPPGPRDNTNTVPSAILLDQVRLHSLLAEKDDLRIALEKANLETKQAESRALAAQKQARYLAAALRAAQQMETINTAPNATEADTIISRANKISSTAERTDS